MRNKRFIIGSRASKLAMAQARYAADELKRLYPESDFEIKQFKTTGDNIPDVALSKIGDKGLFTKEIEEALLRGEVDLAVHSMKDLPTTLSAGLKIAAVTKREDPRDVLVAKECYTIKTLPKHSKVGTSSLRRKAQILRARPDLDVADLRGNLDTRVRKLGDGLYDAIVLAYAGIKRLGLDLEVWAIPVDEMIPQAGQGSLGIEIRDDAGEVDRMVMALDHADSHLAIDAERAFLWVLEGGCQVPIGAYAEVDGGNISLKAGVFSLDGKSAVRDEISGDKKDVVRLGKKLGERMLENSIVRQILNGVKRHS